LDVTANEVAKQIVDAAYRVHTSLGPCWNLPTKRLAYALEKRGLRTVRQQAVPLVYQDTRMEVGFRADLIVEDNVIVEIKSVEAIAPVHQKQLLTHLRLADKRLGLLINFHVTLIKDSIKRIANGMPDGSHAKTPRRKEILTDLPHPILCEKPLHLVGLRRSLVSF
jgi:GxxExxY protein